MIMTVIRYIGEKLNGVAYTVDPELAERISLEKIEKEKALICNKVGEVKIKKAQLKDDIEMEKQLKDMVGSTRTYSGFLRKKNSKLQQEITGLEEQINTINRNA
jgi:hypothetical protein